MIGWTRRARESRATRERAWNDYASWRTSMMEKYNLPDDLGWVHDEICRDILRTCAPEQIPEALLDSGHYPVTVRETLTLRCRLWGCEARDACQFEPWCTDCRGRCKRCGAPVHPRVRAIK